MKKTAILTLTLAMILGAGGAWAGMSLLSVSPRVDYVAPSDLDGTIGVGAVVDVGALTPMFGLAFTADYWSSNLSGYDGWDLSDFALGARSRYNLVIDNPAFVPYFTAGLALHFFSWDLPEAVTGLPGYSASVDDSETKLGLDLGGGLDFNNNMFIEARYRVVSDVDQFTIGGGFSFNLGN